MTDPIAVLSAAAAAVTLFDSIADQVERFIKKRPEPAVPPEYRMTIGEADGDLVAREHGEEIQRITGEDLAKRNLPQPILDYVLVLEKSMQNHYTVWSMLYPQLAVLDSPVQKATVEADPIRQVVEETLNGATARCSTALIVARYLRAEIPHTELQRANRPPTGRSRSVGSLGTRHF
jgi:hypothetical protein